MALVNISQAARMAGKSRMTVHRRIKNGELSIQNGLIDTSELLRVFGELVTHDKNVPKIKPDTASNTKVQFEVLQAKFEGLAKESALKDAIIESLREQVRLLEHKPASNESKPVEMDATRKKEGRLIKFGRFLFDD